MIFRRPRCRSSASGRARARSLEALAPISSSSRRKDRAHGEDSRVCAITHPGERSCSTAAHRSSSQTTRVERRLAREAFGGTPPARSGFASAGVLNLGSLRFRNVGGRSSVVDEHLHETALRRDARHPDRRAGGRQRHARPAEVADRRVRRAPSSSGVVEERVGREPAVALLDAVRMEADPVGRVEAEGRVVGLDARPPDLAVVRPEQQVRVRVDRQERGRRSGRDRQLSPTLLSANDVS